MKKWLVLSLILGFAFSFNSCKKKEVPLVENGFYFDYKKYDASKTGGCVAGGLINHTWDVNLVNIPESGQVNITSNYYSGDCENCCGVQVTDNPVSHTYVAVSGIVWHEGPLVGFDVEVRDVNDLVDGENIQLKGSYLCRD